tara:strand:- start:392 stop:970 length:579 start_codon:yes stop_codon:yes gene_type:complete
MSDKLIELKIKKLLKEYEYLLIEDEYNENFISEHKSSFLKSIKDREVELGLREAEESIMVENSDLEDNKDETEVEKPEPPNREIRRKIKNLFRKIVKLTHPDKVNSEHLIEKYIKAKKYYEDYDLLGLCVLCSELNIKIDISDLKLDELLVSINKKKLDISNLESSYLWMWANAETEEEKNKFVEMFINRKK